MNFPVLRDCFESPRDHEGSLIDGMDTAYEHAIARRDELLDDHAFWESIIDVPIRQVIRATMFYLLLLRRLEQPEAAASMKLAQAMLDEGLGADVKFQSTPFIPYERQELLACDIPVFYTRPGSRDLMSGRGDRYPDYHRTNAVTQMRDRFGSLDTEYCNRQAEIVRYHLPLAPLRHLFPEEVIPSMRARGAEV